MGDGVIPLFLATGNSGKIKEIENFLGSLGFLQLISEKDLDNRSGSVETGSMFWENARIKAYDCRKRLNMPNIMAEDSGLEVQALGNLPGVRSARFTGDNSGDCENIEKLLREMDAVSDRSARFVSVIVALLGGDEVTFRGEVSGLILRQPQGKGGFGYDSVFLFPPLNQSFAELSVEEKNRISHRAQALSAFREFLLKRFGS